MSIPPNKDWEAFENRQPPVDPSGVPFFVSGKVETNNGAIKPVLTKREPQGINSSDLLLNLTLQDTGGGGTDDVAYRDARYDDKVSQDRYSTVSILFENDPVTTFKVTILEG